ncbi:MAG: hypothetical protein SAK29_17515 [Scytonema sp. PMC 1069.18]|nr:hypothetical protein [Scytonema sp. PMC 1069.18]MEC4880228.1 hypothetical protein [Scytonema sp. PMC 1070.18]
MSFKKETPILYFNPRSSTRWSKRQYLLLPAWSYRVVAPRVHQRDVNILEKAVLGMCHVGAFSAVEIGEILDIGSDLAGLVIQQLSDNNFINNHGLLTEEGLKLLEQETWITQDIVAGFIFQDPWTRELFPRFVERQEYMEVQFNQNGYPDLVFGTTGKPDYRRAYMPLPVEDVVKAQPSTQEILKAVKQHDKALHYRGYSEEGEDDEEIWTSAQVPNLKRISFVEEDPTPVWIATYIYLPENSLSATIWNVCDPFGLGDSPWLHRRLSRQIDNNLSFRGLKKIIQEMSGENREEGVINSGLTDFIRFVHNEAVMKVENKLTLEIRRWQSLFNNLVAMERNYIEADLLASSTNVVDKLDDVLVKAQKAVESLFLTIREIYSTDNSWKILSPSDREYNKNLLNKLADNLGFTTPLPKSLVDVKQGKVKSAADYGEGSLRSHLLAALLTTRHDNKHPLQLVAQNAPEMLARLDNLAELRDKSSHFSNQQLTIQDVSLQISTVYEFIARMLGIPYQE